jgi:hypothetical protein
VFGFCAISRRIAGILFKGICKTDNRILSDQDEFDTLVLLLGRSYHDSRSHINSVNPGVMMALAVVEYWCRFSGCSQEQFEDTISIPLTITFTFTIMTTCNVTMTMGTQ